MRYFCGVRSYDLTLSKGFFTVRRKLLTAHFHCKLLNYFNHFGFNSPPLAASFRRAEGIPSGKAGIQKLDASVRWHDKKIPRRLRRGVFILMKMRYIHTLPPQEVSVYKQPFLLIRRLNDTIKM